MAGASRQRSRACGDGAECLSIRPARGGVGSASTRQASRCGGLDPVRRSGVDNGSLAERVRPQGAPQANVKLLYVGNIAPGPDWSRPSGSHRGWMVRPHQAHAEQGRSESHAHRLPRLAPEHRQCSVARSHTLALRASRSFPRAPTARRPLTRGHGVKDASADPDEVRARNHLRPRIHHGHPARPPRPARHHHIPPAPTAPGPANGSPSRPR